jgi:hypothetical protein
MRVLYGRIRDGRFYSAGFYESFSVDVQVERRKRERKIPLFLLLPPGRKIVGEAWVLPDGRVLLFSGWL